MKHFNILVCKETRQGEQRVALVPEDIQKLVVSGHQVYVEHNAGSNAGFTDADYQKCGAKIRFLSEESTIGYRELFKGVNLIVRAKRPESQREALERIAFAPGMIMVGAFEPLIKNRSHIEEYHRAGIDAYSIDLMVLDANDPMNLVSVMRKITGKLAISDAISKCHYSPKTVLIIGFGRVGRAALAEALVQGLEVSVLTRNEQQVKTINNTGAKAVYFDKKNSLFQQQQIIKSLLSSSDIVVTSARRLNEVAPLLIPQSSLKVMKSGSVIIDMALSDGGNVEGSERDAVHIINGVVITNVNNYPNLIPYETSKLWSRATRLFIELLTSEQPINLSPC